MLERILHAGKEDEPGLPLAALRVKVYAGQKGPDEGALLLNGPFLKLTFP
jgi:hypothetical protein